MIHLLYYKRCEFRIVRQLILYPFFGMLSRWLSRKKYYCQKKVRKSHGGIRYPKFKQMELTFCYMQLNYYGEFIEYNI